MSRSSSAVGSGVGARSPAILRLPADRVADGLERRPRMEEVEAHLSALVEVVDAQVGDDDRRPAPQPALLAADPGRVLRSAEVARARPEVDALDERALRLAHDHEHLAGVDGDLARPAGARQACLRMVVVVADDRRVDVAEAIDLGRAEEAHVDQAALQVEAEQLVHAGHRGRTGHDRRVADRQWQARRAGAEHAGFVDQLELGRDGALGQVDRDVGQPDAHEADALAGQLPRGRHDHHLGLRERGRAGRRSVAHGTSAGSR